MSYSGGGVNFSKDAEVKRKGITKKTKSRFGCSECKAKRVLSPSKTISERVADFLCEAEMR